MRNGFRVYDSDTHVNPAAEVLERYVDPGFRPRLAELAPYRSPIGRRGRRLDGLHNYRVATKFYRRVLGEAAPRETFTGRETNGWAASMPRPGVQDDQAENRVKDMDDEGTDAHFLIPTSWVSLVGLPDPALEIGMIRAYHRHMADFCGQYPEAPQERDRGLHARRRRGGARDPRVGQFEVGGRGHAAARQGHPGGPPRPRADLAGRAGTRSADRPPQLYLEPALLPRLPGPLGQHLPRPPGVAPLGRDAVCRRRSSAAGIIDRYPGLRMGVLECGFGWLPFWARRMDEQAVYVGGTAPLKHAPSEYLTSGRFFCSIEHHEGEDMFNYVTGLLGDDVLMYASDYPHSECQFPIRWTTSSPGRASSRHSAESSSGTTRPGSTNRPERPTRNEARYLNRLSSPPRKPGVQGNRSNLAAPGSRFRGNDELAIRGIFGR